jgi:hypothetical protein
VTHRLVGKSPEGSRQPVGRLQLQLTSLPHPRSEGGKSSDLGFLLGLRAGRPSGGLMSRREHSSDLRLMRTSQLVSSGPHCLSETSRHDSWS